MHHPVTNDPFPRMAIYLILLLFLLRFAYPTPLRDGSFSPWISDTNFGFLGYQVCFSMIIPNGYHHFTWCSISGYFFFFFSLVSAHLQVDSPQLHTYIHTYIHSMSIKHSIQYNPHFLQFLTPFFGHHISTHPPLH